MMGRTQPQGELGSCFLGRKQENQSLEVRSELSLFEKTRANMGRVVDVFWILFLYYCGLPLTPMHNLTFKAAYFYTLCSF